MGAGFGLLIRLIFWFWAWFAWCCGWLTSCVPLCLARRLGLLICGLLWYVFLALLLGF